MQLYTCMSYIPAQWRYIKNRLVLIINFTIGIRHVIYQPATWRLYQELFITVKGLKLPLTGQHPFLCCQYRCWVNNKFAKASVAFWRLWDYLKIERTQPYYQAKDSLYNGTYHFVLHNLNLNKQFNHFNFSYLCRSLHNWWRDKILKLEVL